MSGDVCGFSGCGRPRVVRGFCRSHYSQLRRGRSVSELTPLAPRLPRGLRVADRLAFYSSPAAGGCVIFTGALNPYGYGILSVSNTARLAHRLAYELSVGPIPAGAVVRHSCDTPACVNPEHLSVGAQRDNVADAIGRDRFACGENVPTHKLTDADCDRIRAAYAAGMRVSEIAAWFPQVGSRHVYRVAAGTRRARPTNRGRGGNVPHGAS